MSKRDQSHSYMGLIWIPDTPVIISFTSSIARHLVLLSWRNNLLLASRDGLEILEINWYTLTGSLQKWRKDWTPCFKFNENWRPEYQCLHFQYMLQTRVLMENKRVIFFSSWSCIWCQYQLGFEIWFDLKRLSSCTYVTMMSSFELNLPS